MTKTMKNLSTGLVLGTSVFVFVVCFFLLSNEHHSIPQMRLVSVTQNEKTASNLFLIHPYTTLQNACRSRTVVLVVSKTSHFFRREVIRKTWGSLQMQINYDFKLYFLLGREKNVDLKNESLTRKDIIQVDIIENYYNLTRKTILAFTWVSHFCQKASYFFKTDDDVFLNLDFLKNINNNKNLVPENVIVGTCFVNSTPHRKNSKWSVSLKDYPNSTYPPYCMGAGYVMTINTAKRIYPEMNISNAFFFEDVYVGIVAKKLRLSVKTIANFANFLAHYRNVGALVHSLTPYKIQELWNKKLSSSENGTHRPG